MSEANRAGIEPRLGCLVLRPLRPDAAQTERRLRQLLRGDVVVFEKCDLVVIVLKKRFIFF
ncbi:hypothetical protein HK44_013465 [Pseudomonas fluorescens HK44]|uniref:Uncharacterized protein n=1 Tax=Pseudomonas fluorescens HK44 TaxID=1042209 RepID=A0A010T3T3_PSEFL|nr:hypothetical protein HK44_013465 [Pseudomonas fluorescens HK44]